MKSGNVFLCILFSVLIAGNPSAWSSDLEQIKKLDEQVLQQKKNIENVQSGISTQQSKIEESRKREAALLGELEQIDLQVAAESEKLAGLERDMQLQDVLTLEKMKETDRILAEKEALRHHMEQRLAAYYRMGDIGIMNATFSADSVSDLTNLEDNFHFMLQNDLQVITRYKEKMDDLDAARKIHEEEKMRLSQVAQLVYEQQNTLEEKQQERKTVLERVKMEKSLYQRAMAELESAAKELSRTMKELEGRAQEAKKEREMKLIRDYPLKAFKKRKPTSAKGFAAEKGKLPLPAAGTIVRSFKKPTEDSTESSAQSTGIDIECPPGSDIQAVYEGKIVYAGAMRGYGNLIIIDHGNHYYSLVSGVGEILAKVGDSVKQHDKIGITSLHTGLLREGLHFEIRYNAEVQDPFSWVDPSQLPSENHPTP